LYKYEVGKPFIEGKTRFSEGVHFDFQQGGPVLILFYDRPTSEEIEEVKKGRAEFAFYEKLPVIFFLCRFGSSSWADAPYSVHISKPFTFEPLQEGAGFGLQIYLVDATTGILKAMRLIGLKTDFSRRLKLAIERQKAEEFNESMYNFEINRTYKNYSIDDLVKCADAYMRA